MASPIQELFKDMMSAILRHNPQNPIKFMIESLTLIQEKQERGEPYSNIEIFDGCAKKYAGFSLKAEERMESANRGRADVSDLKHLNVQYNFARRGSVSAESLRPTDSLEPKKVIPKSKEAYLRIATAISHNLLFRNLTEEQRQEVVDAMFEKKVTAGESVIRQGDDGDYFYVVDEGQFDIFVNGKKVVEVGPGGSFGELALMYNCPRAATVTATRDSVLWAVDRITFQKTVMNNTFRKRKLYESFLQSVPILHSLTIEELIKVADALEPVCFEDGQPIIEQGELGDCFYLLVKGDCVVTKTINEGDEPEEVMRLKPGDYFGELALLTDKPRAATVTAVGDVECVVLDVKAFIRLLGPCTDVLKRNAENYKKYEGLLAK